MIPPTPEASGEPQLVSVEPEPNPRAPWPDPTPEMLESPTFEAIWQCIKRWDINVPSVYNGYMGATGNHVRAILDALASLPAAQGGDVVCLRRYDPALGQTVFAPLPDALDARLSPPQAGEPLHTGDNELVDDWSSLRSAMETAIESAAALPQVGGEEASIQEQLTDAVATMDRIDAVVVAALARVPSPQGAPACSHCDGDRGNAGGACCEHCKGTGVEPQGAPEASVEAWQPIETAPKDGRTIIIDFGRIGVYAVFWSEEPFGKGIGSWCVTDNKHEDRPLRGWCEGDECGWLPMPAALQRARLG